MSKMIEPPISMDSKKHGGKSQFPFRFELRKPGSIDEVIARELKVLKGTEQWLN